MNISLEEMKYYQQSARNCLIEELFAAVRLKSGTEALLHIAQKYTGNNKTDIDWFKELVSRKM